LIEPPYDRQQWYSIAGEYGAIGAAAHRAGFDRTSYSDHLFGARYRSPSSRYARLIDDIRNDMTRLPQLFETAARVLDIDRKRQQSLAYISGLSDGDRRDAMRRVRENIEILRLVQASLDNRASSYALAMERSPQAVEVERSLKQLRGQMARYRSGAPTGRVASAH